jgi:transposase
MSIQPISDQGSLFDAGVYLEDMLKRAKGGERFLFFREKVWPALLSLGPSLNTMYCADNGRPAVNPVRLLGVTLLQYMEKLPDRQAVEAMVFDIRWKCALEMEVDEGGFDPTVLVRFRERLQEHGLEGMGFEAALEAMRQAGYSGKKTRQRVDSTHVLGLVAEMSRLECVRETMRLALLALEREERLSRPDAWSLWWERYVESKPDYREKAEVLRLKMNQAGADIHEVLLWMESLGKEAPESEAVELLKRVFEENFERAQGGTVEQRPARPSGAVQNPHDPQAQWSTKDTTRRKEWVGYKAQVAETVEEKPRKKGEPTRAVLTAIVTQEAIASDKAALPVVEQALEKVKEPTPEVMYVDAGYTSGAELARAQQEGREVRGPVQPGAPRKDGGYTSEAFDVSIENRSAVCPAGQKSTNCSRLENGKTGGVKYRFEWNRGLCDPCDRRGQCLGKGQRHRTLLVGERHDLIQSRRQEQKTEEFTKDMRHRNAIEGTISELCRGYGLRRCRYRGIDKTRVQNTMIAAACNIKRWWKRMMWEQREAARGIMNQEIAGAPT